MTWEVQLHTEFSVWLDEQTEAVQDEILAAASLLKEYGPMLGRPRVDSVYGSKHANMKELRIQYKGQPWRVLFAFDPKRRAIVLVGGNKQGEKRWYDTQIPIADRRFTQHLEAMKNTKL